MKVIQFAADSPEGEAAMRCAEKIVNIPGYGIVWRAELSLLDGIETVTVHFLNSGVAAPISNR